MKTGRIPVPPSYHLLLPPAVQCKHHLHGHSSKQAPPQAPLSLAVCHQIFRFPSICNDLFNLFLNAFHQHPAAPSPPAVWGPTRLESSPGTTKYWQICCGDISDVQKDVNCCVVINPVPSAKQRLAHTRGGLICSHEGNNLALPVAN